MPGGTDVLRWVNSGNGGAVRTFSDLNESSRELNARYQLGFGQDQQSSIKIGGLIRSTDRDAETRAYSVSAPGISNSIRELTPEEIFDGRFSSANISISHHCLREAHIPLATTSAPDSQWPSWRCRPGSASSAVPDTRLTGSRSLLSPPSAIRCSPGRSGTICFRRSL